MKKTFWGYNAKEVDENIEFLESQNIKLEKQVKQLSADLEKAKNELEEEKSRASETPVVQDDEKNNTILELQEKISQITNENSELKSKIEQLPNVPTKEQSSSFDNVGDICKVVYEDMYNVKKKTKDQILDFLEDFWKECKLYQDQLLSLIEQAKSREQENRESFIAYADSVLQVYNDMENTNNELDNEIAKLFSNREKTEEKLVNMLSALDKSFDNEETNLQKEKETASEPENTEKNSILNEINKLKKSKQDPEQETDTNEISAEITKDGEAAGPIFDHYFETDKEEVNISQNVNIRNII